VVLPTQVSATTSRQASLQAFPKKGKERVGAQGVVVAEDIWKTMYVSKATQILSRKILGSPLLRLKGSEGRKTNIIHKKNINSNKHNST